MPIFKDADEVYAHVGKLFQAIVDDEELGAQFERANTIVQYRLREPDAVVTVKTVEGQERRVDLGETQLRPEVVLATDADTAHRFWLGKVNVTVALARGHIRASGPVIKILKLVPLVKPVLPRYRAQLEADGRRDLAEAS